MHYTKLKTWTIIIFLLWVDPLFALQTEEKVPTFGEIAEKMIVGTEFLTRLVLGVCISIGIILIISSLASFRAHIRNPKFQPLDRPFFLFVFGAILLAIPFLGKIFAPTGSVLELKKEVSSQAPKRVAPVDIDAPLEFGNEYDH